MLQRLVLVCALAYVLMHLSAVVFDTPQLHDTGDGGCVKGVV